MVGFATGAAVLGCACWAGEAELSADCVSSDIVKLLIAPVYAGAYHIGKRLLNGIIANNIDSSYLLR